MRCFGIFFKFFPEIGHGILCPQETVLHEMSILFSEKNKKNHHLLNWLKCAKGETMINFLF